MDFRAARPVYPFSVVPGGVYDSQELTDSYNRDPVVRKHYRNIRVEGVWTARTQRPILAYVSYRKGNTVRWTKHKVRIPRGELVLTDGTNVIRARCGNRIRQLPPPLDSTTKVQDDPPEIVFDTPTPPVVELPASSLPALVKVIPVPPLAAPPESPTFVPLVPVEPPTVPRTPPPLSPVPEPGTIVLFASGLAMIGSAAWRRR